MKGVQKTDGTYLAASDFASPIFFLETIGEAKAPYPLSVTFGNRLTFEAKESLEIAGIYEYQLLVAAYPDVDELENQVYFPDSLFVEVTGPPLTFDEITDILTSSTADTVTVNADRTVTVSLPPIVALLGQGQYTDYNIMAKAKDASFDYGIKFNRSRKEIIFGPFNKHLEDENTFISTINISQGVNKAEISITVNIIGKDTTLGFDKIWSYVLNSFPDQLELN